MEFDCDMAEQRLKKELSQKRYLHTLGVAACCSSLAGLYKYDEKKAYIAGLLHDCAKDMDNSAQREYAQKMGEALGESALEFPAILHAPVGALRAKYDYKITDEEILEAIACHTTGRENMGLLDKILFVADYIEPNRNYPATEHLREAARRNLDEAVIACMDNTISHVLEKGELLCLDTVKARNFLLREQRHING